MGRQDRIDFGPERSACGLYNYHGPFNTAYTKRIAPFLNSEVGLSGCDVHTHRPIASITVLLGALKSLHARYTPWPCSHLAPITPYSSLIDLIISARNSA